MRSPSNGRPPASGGAGDDDFAFYYSFLQDAAPAPLDIVDAAAAAAAMTNGGGRKRKQAGDEQDAVAAGAAGGKKDGGKKRSIARILTSLVALEAEEHADRAGAADASRRELALLESNADARSQAMTDYYAKMEGSFDAAADADVAARSKRSRLAASAATAAVVAAGEDAAAASAAASGSPTRGGASGPGHHHRRLWVKDRSRAWWDKCNSPDFPEAEFRRAFRMGRETFDMICDALGAAVAKEDTMLRAAIPVRQRVAVCVWRLATGEPLRLVSKRFGLGISTCHKLVLEVCAAIKSVLMPRFLQWPDEAAAARFKDTFERTTGVPNVIGAMYTTHIPIIAPKISVAAYFNRRHTERNQKTSYSITLQGVVGPDGAFTDVCIGWPGSMPDDQVLEKSMLHQRAAAGMMHESWLPEPKVMVEEREDDGLSEEVRSTRKRSEFVSEVNILSAVDHDNAMSLVGLCLDVYAFGVVLLELNSGRKPVSLVMWATTVVQGGKLMCLVDPSLPPAGGEVEKMALAAALCIQREPPPRVLLGACNMGPPR
ncbi:hypothetical protein EJB05_16071, partial [Eragrostis curvula]